MMRLMTAGAVCVLAACSTTNTSIGEPLPDWQFEGETMFFPQSRSLTHAEDGVVLDDGTLLVGDWTHGLVAIGADGTVRPFGDFAAAGFKTKPAPDWGSPNGVSFEPDGRHILVADITTGAIYRADTQTESVSRIYDHQYGVNSVVRDGKGAIWFTQSTENPEGEGSEARMFAAIDGMGDGAVYRIAPDQVGLEDPIAEPIITGLDFANGIAVDEKRNQLYVTEIAANRVWTYPVDFANGRVGEGTVLADIVSPDNVELDTHGQLWVASPFGNEVVMIDPDSGAVHPVFQPTPVKSAEIKAEVLRRIDEGESVLPLLTPEVWGPMPGLLTGVILTPGGGPVYVSGLGDALIKLEPRP